jgi:hypothetical protein
MVSIARNEWKGRDVGDGDGEEERRGGKDGASGRRQLLGSHAWPLLPATPNTLRSSLNLNIEHSTFARFFFSEELHTEHGRSTDGQQRTAGEESAGKNKQKPWITVVGVLRTAAAVAHTPDAARQ